MKNTNLIHDFSSKVIAGNPFKGAAGLVVRKLISSAGTKWSGNQLSEELNLSQAWVNRVLETLLGERHIQRVNQGVNSYTEVISSKKILSKWVLNYRFDLNQGFYYLKQNIKCPISCIDIIAKKEDFDYAITGNSAAEVVLNKPNKSVPMIYIWPKLGGMAKFKEILSRLENYHDFIPVGKQANLIILKPHLKEATFFESQKHKNFNIVSPTQLYLDLNSIVGKDSYFNQLAPYFNKNRLNYEL